LLEQLNQGQQQFRSFFLKLIADADRRHKYFVLRHDQEYGPKFVARTKELMRRFVSEINNLLPACAIDQVISQLLFANMFIYFYLKLGNTKYNAKALLDVTVQTMQILDDRLHKADDKNKTKGVLSRFFSV